MSNPTIPETKVTFAQSGASNKPDELGMGGMQARAYGKMSE